MSIELKAGDVFLTRGTSFVSTAIRWFTRHSGESRTEVNHVGLVVTDGDTGSAEIVEALTRTRRRRMSAYVGSKTTKVAIYRPAFLTDEERARVVAKAETYVGRKYGYLKLVAHAIDRVLGGYWARRLVSMDRYPICSWVVAYSYSDAVGYWFGWVPPWAADPDHIWDDIVESDAWVQVHPLEKLP